MRISRMLVRFDSTSGVIQWEHLRSRARRRMKPRVLVCLCLALAVVAVAAEEEEEEDVTKAPGGGPKRPQFRAPTYPEGDVYFVETFNDEAAVWKRWIKSTAKKEGSAKYDGEWALQSPDWEGSMEEDKGLVMTETAKHYAMSAELERPFVFEGKDGFVVQYDVNFQEGLTCGGAYVKLLLEMKDLGTFFDKTPYSIMFGPDRCGTSSKVHVIIRFKNPKTGEVEEKHSKQSTLSMDFFEDKKTHLFTLFIRSDGVYHVMLDQNPFVKGNLLEDLTPPIIPSEEIDDPDDKMPPDWDEREKIPEPDAVKPEDWDESAPLKIPDPDATKPEGWLDDGPEYIPDPEASMPDDWDEEEDGEWEAPMITNPVCEEVGCGQWTAPMIQNPNYKGKWKPPLIDNPDYMGKWKPQRISNPSYFEDEHPFESLLTIHAIGFELWTMSAGIHFDNILITSELAVANNFAREGWVLKMEYEKAVGGAMSMGPWIDWFIDTANEYPYLWALYAFVIVSPFVICAAFCVKSKPKPKEDEAAKRKKTDAPSPDDLQPAGGKGEGEGEGEGKGKGKGKEEEEEERQPSPPPEQSFIAEDDQPEASVSGQETSKEVDGQESSLGEASQGEAASLEEASQGEASQGEASQVSQEELSQGEAEVSHEEEDAGTWEKAGKKGGSKGKSTRKRRTRRED